VSDFPVRVAKAEDYDAMMRCFGAALMFEFPPDEKYRAAFEPDRALVVTDGDEVVGTTRVLTRDLSIPGAIVPAAHVTGVGVSATHRRRGILRSMMTEQLRTTPEAIAVLWASEPGIYGRFGYGAAAWFVSYEVDLPRIRPPRAEPSGRVRAVPLEDAGKLLAPVLEGLRRYRPGLSGRDEQWWELRLQDLPEHRRGRTAREVLVHEDESGTVDGYAMWRGKFGSGPGGIANEISLEELVANDLAAYQALWSHLLTMDLTAKLDFGYAAVDEPLMQLVGNTEALQRRICESLWVRITDVERALEQRRYATNVDLVLEIADDLLPDNAGRFRLTGDGEKARCERTDAAADLALSVTALGAAYLGGRSLAEFAVTGQVRELRPGALAAASAAFGWPVAPASIEVF
jgi:predicted acetyltransferase